MEREGGKGRGVGGYLERDRSVVFRERVLLIVSREREDEGGRVAVRDRVLRWRERRMWDGVGFIIGGIDWLGFLWSFERSLLLDIAMV